MVLGVLNYTATNMADRGYIGPGGLSIPLVQVHQFVIFRNGRGNLHKVHGSFIYTRHLVLVLLA